MSKLPKGFAIGQQLMAGVFYVPEQRRIVIFASELKRATDAMGEPYCEQAAVVAAVRMALADESTEECLQLRVYLPDDGPACAANAERCDNCPIREGKK